MLYYHSPLIMIVAILSLGVLFLRVSTWMHEQARLFTCLLYLALLLFFTILNRTPSVERSIIITPFWSYGQFYRRAIRHEVLLNIFLFIPFGFLLPWATKLSFKKTLLIGFVFSTLIEATQYIFYLGLCEFDDVFHNTLGTAIGYWYWRGLEHLSKRIRENDI